MCGIAGFAGEGDEGILRSMAGALKHRGPDDSGTVHKGAAGLAFARLSILDLSPSGHQPMSDASGRYTIVFNGEIYNYRDVRAELSDYPFTSSGDTEVIIAAYAKWGSECFAKFEGMFAIAIYDTQEETLVIARDRLGKKPLYWTMQNGVFAFASELKALWCHPVLKRELDARGFAHYLAREYVPTPQSMFKGVHKLIPGNFLVLKDGTMREESFWSPQAVPSTLSEHDALARFDSLLDSAVQKRLIADVPLGIFLSGGIDSSTVAYYAAQHGAVETFSVGFAESSFDESHQAKLVASHLHTHHHEMMLSAKDALELVPRIPDVFDEPVADASVLPTMLLSKFTAQKVTVALGGDGADELLLGYPTFRAESFARMYGSVPRIMRDAIAKSISLLPSSSGYFSLDFKAKKFTRDFDTDISQRHFNWLGSFSEQALPLLLAPTYAREALGLGRELTEQWQKEYSSTDPLNRLSHLYLRTYCMDDVLVKVDRASMHYSLEVRTPFLDSALVSFLLSLPSHMKYRSGTSKYLLKKLMRGRLPSEIIDRKKQGFAAPIAAWLRTDLKDLCLDLLAHDRIEKQGIFNASYVDRLVREHMDGTHDHRKELWTLIVFELWYGRWMR